MRRTKREPKTIKTQSNARTIKKSIAKNQKSVDDKPQPEVQVRRYNLRKSGRVNQEARDNIAIQRNPPFTNKNRKAINTQNKRKPSQFQSKPKHQTPTNSHSRQSATHNKSSINKQRHSRQKQYSKNKQLTRNNFSDTNSESKKPHETRLSSVICNKGRVYYGADIDEIQECKKVMSQIKRQKKNTNGKSRGKKDHVQVQMVNVHDESDDSRNSDVQNNEQSNRQQQKKIKSSRQQHQQSHEDLESQQVSANTASHSSLVEQQHSHVHQQQSALTEQQSDGRLALSNSNNHFENDNDNGSDIVQSANNRILPSFSSASSSSSQSPVIDQLYHVVKDICNLNNQPQTLRWKQAVRTIFSPHHQYKDILDLKQEQYCALLQEVEEIYGRTNAHRVIIGELEGIETIELKDDIRLMVSLEDGTVPWILPEWQVEKVNVGKGKVGEMPALRKNGAWQPMNSGGNGLDEKLSDWSDDSQKYRKTLKQHANNGDNSDDVHSSTKSATYWQRAMQPQVFDKYYTRGITYLYSTLSNELNTRDEFQSFQTFIKQNYLHFYTISRFHYKNYCYEKTLFTDSAQFDKNYWQDMIDNHCLILPQIREVIENDWKEKFQRGWDQYDRQVGVKAYEQRRVEQRRDQLQKKLGIGGDRKERVKEADVKRMMQCLLEGETMKGVKVKNNRMQTKRKPGHQEQTVAQDHQHTQQPFNLQHFMYQTILSSTCPTTPTKQVDHTEEVYKALLLIVEQPVSAKRQIPLPKVKGPTEEEKIQRHKILMDMEAKFKNKRRKQRERLNITMMEYVGRDSEQEEVKGRGGK